MNHTTDVGVLWTYVKIHEAINKAFYENKFYIEYNPSKDILEATVYFKDKAIPGNIRADFEVPVGELAYEIYNKATEARKDAIDFARESRT